MKDVVLDVFAFLFALTREPMVIVGFFLSVVVIGSICHLAYTEYIYKKGGPYE